MTNSPNDVFRPNVALSKRNKTDFRSIKFVFWTLVNCSNCTNARLWGNDRQWRIGWGQRSTQIGETRFVECDKNAKLSPIPEKFTTRKNTQFPKNKFCIQNILSPYQISGKNATKKLDTIPKIKNNFSPRKFHPIPTQQFFNQEKLTQFSKSYFIPSVWKPEN